MTTLINHARMEQALKVYRDISYETGWLSGRMESDPDYRTEENYQGQRELIEQRTYQENSILAMISKLIMEAR